MIIGAYCLRITESYYDGRYLSLDNCIWIALLSMTTIGYGDMYVSTAFGVLVDGCLMFAGVVIVSLLVSCLNDIFSMGYSIFIAYILGEKRSLTILKRLN